MQVREGRRGEMRKRRERGRGEVSEGRRDRSG